MKLFKISTLQASYTLIIYSTSILLLSFYFLHQEMMLLLDFSFMNSNSMKFTLQLILEWKGLLFSTIVTFISSMVMLFTTNYMFQDTFLSRFTWVVMLFVLSMNLLIFIPNLVTLLLGWDGLGLISFCLVIYYQNYKSLTAGLITAFMNRMGDVAIILAITFFSTQGHFNILLNWNSTFNPLLAILILIAGMTKSAQLPFCSWLPAAMAAPTPVSALVHSSTLVTAGVFLLIRFYPLLSSFPLFNYILMMIATMTMLMAGMSANLETDLKKIIALSTLSQLGVMMLTVSLGLFNMALFHLFTHALFKALLFLCAGNIIHHHNNNQDIRKMSHLWFHLPISSTCFNIANLALCGFPFMAGFYSKDLIIELMLFNQVNIFICLMMIIATALTASYSVRLSITIFWSEPKQNCFISSPVEDSFVATPIILLSLGALFSGSLFSWLFFSPLATPVISTLSKISPLSSIIIASIIMFLIFNKEILSASSLIKTFVYKMWFMTNLSVNKISFSPLNFGLQSFKFLDAGWLEIPAKNGLFILLKKMMFLNQGNQKNIFNTTFAVTMIFALFFSLMMLML